MTKQPSRLGRMRAGERRPERPSHAIERLPGLPTSASGAPLPLVTQPLISVSDGAPDGPDQTQVMSPIAALEPRAPAAVRFAAPANAEAPRAGPPPEIGLTEHQLPSDRRPDPRLALMLDPDSERSAAFRVLRHHLLELGHPQCIVVSSPRGGDGKTTTAVNLALALAECGRAKVLLLDAHLRRPRLARIFDLTPTWCFAEQLAAHRHQPMMPWSLVDIPQLWLHVAAIDPDRARTQLLDGPAFAIAIERLRLGGYDHIVIDAPPVLGTADVNLMADTAETVVLALRARRSTTRDLRRAIEQLGPAKIAGTVLVQD